MKIIQNFLKTEIRKWRFNSQLHKGFTLIELILYVAIVSIFISGAVLFAWDVIYGRVKSQIQRDVNHNIRLISKRIIYETRNASGINYVSATDLCLANSDTERNPTRIYLDTGRLQIGWGGGSIDCTGLIVNQPLTSNNINVTNLNFTDLSNGDSQNIKFEITVESTADRQEWQLSESYEGAAEVR